MFEQFRHFLGSLQGGFPGGALPMLGEPGIYRPSQVVRTSGRTATGSYALAVLPSAEEQCNGGAVVESVLHKGQGSIPRALFGVIESAGRGRLGGDLGELLASAMKSSTANGAPEKWWNEAQLAIQAGLIPILQKLPRAEQRSREIGVRVGVMKVFGDALRGEVLGPVLAFVMRRGEDCVRAGDLVADRLPNPLFSRYSRNPEGAVVACVDFPNADSCSNCEEPTVDTAESLSVEDIGEFTWRCELPDVSVLQSGVTRNISTELTNDELVVMASPGFWRIFPRIEELAEVVQVAESSSPASGVRLAEHVRDALMGRRIELQAMQHGQCRQEEATLLVYAHRECGR